MNILGFEFNKIELDECSINATASGARKEENFHRNRIIIYNETFFSLADINNQTIVCLIKRRFPMKKFIIPCLVMLGVLLNACSSPQFLDLMKAESFNLVEQKDNNYIFEKRCSLGDTYALLVGEIKDQRDNDISFFSVYYQTELFKGLTSMERSYFLEYLNGYAPEGMFFDFSKYNDLSLNHIVPMALNDIPQYTFINVSTNVVEAACYSDAYLEQLLKMMQEQEGEGPVSFGIAGSGDKDNEVGKKLEEFKKKFGVEIPDIKPPIE